MSTGWGARATQRDKAGAWRGSESDRRSLGGMAGWGGVWAQPPRWCSSAGMIFVSSIRSNGSSNLEFSSLNSHRVIGRQAVVVSLISGRQMGSGGGGGKRPRPAGF